MLLCYKARHQLNLSKADEGRSLQLHFADVSRIAGESPLISRFNFPDLRQLSPHEPSLTEHGGRVRVVGEPRRRSSVVRKLNRFLNNKILQKRSSLFRTKKILWSHSSELPRTKCHYFLVQLYSSQLQPSRRLSCPGTQFPGRKKNFAIPKAKLNVPTRTTGCSERRQPTLLCHLLHPQVWQ